MCVVLERNTRMAGIPTLLSSHIVNFNYCILHMILKISEQENQMLKVTYFMMKQFILMLNIYWKIIIIEKAGNKLIPARSRMLLETATGHLPYRLWQSTSSHLVQDVHTVFCVVEVNHRLWFCLRPTKGAHTCVHGAQDASFFLSFPWYTVRVTSFHYGRVEQLRSLFHGGGNSRCCLPLVPKRQYDTTIW